MTRASRCHWTRGDRVRLCTDHESAHPATVVKVIGRAPSGLSLHDVLVDYDDGRRLGRGCRALEKLEALDAE